MSFLFEGESFITPSITSESTTTSQTWKKGKKSSLIWAYTRQSLEGKDPDLLCYSYYLVGEE
jgi:hypothetical protein